MSWRREAQRKERKIRNNNFAQFIGLPPIICAYIEDGEFSLGIGKEKNIFAFGNSRQTTMQRKSKRWNKKHSRAHIERTQFIDF